MGYLKTHDSDLSQSKRIAIEQGYNINHIDSIRLATLLKASKVRAKIWRTLESEFK